MNAAENDGVFVDFLLLNRINILLKEAELLVLCKFILTRSEGIKIAHRGEEFFINHALDLLEVERVCVSLADLLACVAKHVEECLEDARHLHDVKIFEVQEGLLPVFGRQGRMIRRSITTDLRSVWSSSALCITSGHS